MVVRIAGRLSAIENDPPEAGPRPADPECICAARGQSNAECVTEHDALLVADICHRLDGIDAIMLRDLSPVLPWRVLGTFQKLTVFLPRLCSQ